MKANELRIGNLIYQFANFTGESAGYYSAFEVTINVLRAIEDGANGFEPIPLAEKWLAKFGFIENILCWNYDKFTIAKGLEDSFALTGYCLGNVFPKEIKYVHQLQNLYFALTGEELTLKDNLNES